MTAAQTDESNDTEVTGVTTEDRINAALRHAKGFGKVVAVTSHTGRRYQYLPYLAESVGDTLWIEYNEQTDHSQIVSEGTVYNMIRMSTPDVELVREQDSAFARGD